jgi:hypothetical protein
VTSRDCIGWFPGLLITPAPGGDGTDDRLGTGMDMDVLDGDALLTLVAVTVEGSKNSNLVISPRSRIARSVGEVAPRQVIPMTRAGRPSLTIAIGSER